MPEGFDDLLPLFLAEAADRLERLSGLLATLPSDGAAAAKARRELHALKGAGRMLGLAEFSALCHQAEELLERPTPGSVAATVAIYQRLVSMLSDGLAGAAGPPVVEAAEVPKAAPFVPEPGVAELTVRLAPEVIDSLTDRATGMRVLAVAGGGAVERLFRLAHLAERGVGERAPRQVLATLATALRELGGELEAGQRRLQHLSDGLLESLLRQQVRPLRPVLVSLARHARELAEALGKDVHVTVHGGDTLLDRRIVRALQEAFLHVVRNAVDHGIEAPDSREAAGKPRRGEIRLDARLEGDRVRLEVADDGQGIDGEAVAAAALARGELTREEARALGPDQVLQMLFRAGFTTRTEASELSGRGIGLDAVASAVHAVGGDLWLESEPSRGTVVTVEVPLARRGERVLLLRVGRSQVALASAPVRAFRRIGPELLEGSPDRPQLGAGQDPVLLRFLSDLLGEPRPKRATAIVGSVFGEAVAVVADEVIGEEEVLVRRMPSGLGVPELYEGMTVAAGGRPVAVLSWQQIGALAGEGWAQPPGRRPPAPQRVLLADDSRVTREMIRRLLEDAGFEVTAVASGEDALDLLRQGLPFDCLVTDIEMPGLDGLELTRKLRLDPGFAQLPIIVVSTRDRASDHRAGLEAGADAYLSKQGLAVRELVNLVRRSGGWS